MQGTVAGSECSLHVCCCVFIAVVVKRGTQAVQGRNCVCVGPGPVFPPRRLIKTAAQTPCGADDHEHVHSAPPPPPQKLISLYPGGQGTLCPIDLKPDESSQFSFKFSWAALHRPQFQLPSRLTQYPRARACGPPSTSLWSRHRQGAQAPLY